MEISFKKMKSTLKFTRTTKIVKKLTYLKIGVFLLYAPMIIEISSMQFEKNDTEIMVTLPRHYQGYFIQSSDKTRWTLLLATNNEFR